MLLLVFSTRSFLQILIITRTNGDMSHFARVDIFNSGLRKTNFGLHVTIDLKLKQIDECVIDSLHHCSPTHLSLPPLTALFDTVLPDIFSY